MKIKAVNPRTKRSQVTTKAQRDVYEWEMSVEASSQGSVILVSLRERVEGYVVCSRQRRQKKTPKSCSNS